MYRVIIVDDEPLIRSGLIALVNWEEMGIEVAGEAGNGQEALDLINKHTPHIVILDIRMPVMDGIGMLKTLRESGNPIKAIVLSGYDSFNYVKEAMKYNVENYLLKPVNIEELQSTLLNIIDSINKEIYTRIRQRENFNILKNNILNRLIYNQIGEEELQERLDFLSINVNDKFYMAALFEILNLNELSGKQDLQKLTFSMLNIIEMTLSKRSNSICFQNMTGGTVVIVSFSEPEDEKNIISLLEECILNVPSLINLDIMASLGRKVSQKQLLHLSYSDALHLNDYKYFDIRNKLVSYNSENESLSKNKYSISIDFAYYEELLLGCKLDEMNQFLDDILSSSVENVGIHPDYIKSICIELIIQSINIAKYLKLDITKLFPQHNVVEKALECNTANQLFRLIKTINITLMENLNEKKNRPKSIIDEVFEYVNKNFEKEMSLKTLAVEFGVSASYLGQQFKSEANEIFTDYLNKLRVEKTKKLLLSTQKKASEIAFQVGYKDSNYFYKIFKKYTGVFPSEYRQHN